MVKEDLKEDKKKVESRKKTSSKKPNKHLSEIKKLKEEKEQLKDQLLRKVAEFDNYKKRTERDFFDRVQNANERLITELLPVLDDMERALDHAEKSKEVDSLLEGTNLIQKKLKDLLEKQGLEILSAKGEEFDPDKHDALMQLEKENVESGTIIEEHLKGYTLNGKVIRHSQVIVAK
jgi:molecular chaperone GrpE